MASGCFRAIRPKLEGYIVESLNGWQKWIIGFLASIMMLLGGAAISEQRSVNTEVRSTITEHAERLSVREEHDKAVDDKLGEIVDDLKGIDSKLDLLLTNP